MRNHPPTIAASNYGEVFDALWRRLQRSFVKIEFVQEYSQPGNPSYEAFKAGNNQLALALFADSLLGDAKYLDDIPGKGIAYTRIRVVGSEISKYLAFELETYRISALYGQTILIVDDAPDLSLTTLSASGDFMIFDDFGVLDLHYDDSGTFEGADLIDDNMRIQAFADRAVSLRMKSMSLGDYGRKRLNWRY